MTLTKGKLGTWLCALVVSEPPCSRILLHVGLEEHRWSRRAWQVSHTLTGLGEAGSGSSLSEQLLQKISPQLRQWCCGERERERDTLEKCCGVGFMGLCRLNQHVCWPFVLRWRTPSHTACSGWRPCPSTKPDPPEIRSISFVRRFFFFYILHDTQNNKQYDGSILWSSSTNILRMKRGYCPL